MSFQEQRTCEDLESWTCEALESRTCEDLESWTSEALESRTCEGLESWTCEASESQTRKDPKPWTCRVCEIRESVKFGNLLKIKFGSHSARRFPERGDSRTSKKQSQRRRLKKSGFGVWTSGVCEIREYAQD
jgi:hypothetical protein